jgi:hypothetical protein
MAWIAAHRPPIALRVDPHEPRIVILAMRPRALPRQELAEAHDPVSIGRLEEDPGVGKALVRRRGVLVTIRDGLRMEKERRARWDRGELHEDDLHPPAAV